MRDDDLPRDDDGELLPPSRSQKRREALEVFKLAETLAAQSDAQLAHVPLADEIRDEVLRTRAVTSHIARKRATQFLAKQLRKLDDAELETIRGALEHDRDKSRHETALLHRLETWRTRLIDEGDAALDALVALHPSADRQHLRQLARNARAERDREKPLHAYRELFRALRELLDER
jgi:ribosome-associated protein